MESITLRALLLLSIILIPRNAVFVVVFASSFHDAATTTTTTITTTATATATATTVAYFWSSDMSLERKVEEEAGVELPLDVEPHRRILATLDPKTVLRPDQPACIGSCPAKGGPYTGRGCQSYYGCRGGS